MGKDQKLKRVNKELRITNLLEHIPPQDTRLGDKANQQIIKIFQYHLI